MNKNKKFKTEQLEIINNAVEMAEELVSDFYKMSASQWLHQRYDIKTMEDLSSEEIVDGPFAQIVCYKGQKGNTSLSSSTYNFYKICFQDHSILSVLKGSPHIQLFPFILYIVAHELIHIVRFSKFLQNFDASPEERIAEEARVHKITRIILKEIRVSGLANVLKFYDKWETPFDDLRNPEKD